MSKHPNSILIFAAGFGTRMGQLTANMPKPLVPVAGTPMIDRALTITREADIQNITVNLHYKKEMLVRHLEPENIHFSHENPDILDTGGGLRHALPLVGAGPVFTFNPDAIWSGPNPLSFLKAAWNPAKMDALLLLVPKENALGHSGNGDFLLDTKGKLSRGPGLVYSGAQIIKTDLLADIQEQAFSLNLLWDILGEKRLLSGLKYPGKWCDVGTEQGITQAENLLKETNV